MSEAAQDLTQFEQLARINQMVAEANLKTAQADTMTAQMAFAGFTAGAAVIGGIVGLLKILGH